MRELSMPAVIAITILMLAAGVGIPVMAALNTGLGRGLGSPITASAFLLLIGAAICVPLALAMNGIPQRSALSQTPLVFYFGAAFFLLYILSITWASPRIGLGNAVFLVLFGQLISATVIDHFGLFGAIKTEVDMKRIAGLVIMAVGIYLARRIA